MFLFVTLVPSLSGAGCCLALSRRRFLATVTPAVAAAMPGVVGAMGRSEERTELRTAPGNLMVKHGPNDAKW